jgi:hypothetical protein
LQQPVQSDLRHDFSGLLRHFIQSIDYPVKQFVWDGRRLLRRLMKPALFLELIPVSTGAYFYLVVLIIVYLDNDLCL